MSARLVAAFRGPAHCRREAGAVQWSLAGEDRESGARLEVLLCGTAGLQLPEQLAAPELYESGGDAGDTRWELRSAGSLIPTGARAAQVHRDASAAFARVLPRFDAPWRVRAGWTLLLNLLRLPGAARLLRRLRARGAR
jgi:hypothetical protein